MKPAETYYDPISGCFQKPFNVRYEFEDNVYEITLYASCHDQAENVLEAIKQNGIVYSELLEIEE
jgi:hypothetical protein